MDRNKLKTVKEAMLKALKPLEAELGVTFAIGRGTFDTLAWRFNMDVTEGDGKAILAEQEATFKRYADEYGWKPASAAASSDFADARERS